METRKTAFEILNAINCNEHTEKKNGLTYLSWAWAWQIVKKNFPDATYTIYESENGIPYFTDGRTGWVKTGVTINGLEHIEYLPIMDYRNVSIPAEKITSMDMNKAVQRSLTKACARHGLGLYIYAGEDLPDEETEVAQAPEPIPAPVPTYTPCDQEKYWKIIQGYAQGQTTKSGNDLRSFWIKLTHADQEAVAKFDEDVKLYKAANSPKADTTRTSTQK